MLVESGQYRTGMIIKTDIRAVVTNTFNGRARNLHIVDVGLGSNFTRHNNQACTAQSLAGDPCVGILGQDCIQDRVGNLISHLVGMTFGHGFGSKKIVAHVVQPL